MNKQELGRYGEEQARKWFIDSGFTILEQNYRTRFGEIDLIVQKGNEVIFVEVKTRRNADFGFPEESVTARKLDHLQKAASIYLAESETNLQPRFDVLSILLEPEETIEHFESIILPN